MSTDELVWFKSSYSGTGGDNCIEVTTSPDAVHVRDSKDEQGPQLSLTPRSWTAFVTYVAS
ncbi:DUF397 domain-containing protein [Streptomyces sp. NPDC002994]|uniref:DUF397 domain-containing protein n=1 Tax=Streptomyces sp. NPDC002994 TaxID=3154441 RepID=UPI0033A47AAC